MEGKWIWNKEEYTKDDYSEFTGFFMSSGKETVINISADSNYAIYLNNKFVDSTGYSSFKGTPVIDTVKLKAKDGLNDIKILVYYNGNDTFSNYYKDVPGLCFDVIEEGKIVLSSSEKILSRRSKTFINNQCKIITPQLGYRFFYDANNEKDESGFDKSVVIEKSRNFEYRENQKLDILKEVDSKIIVKEDDYIIVDLLKEQTGFIKLDFTSKKKQRMIVSFGEHIVDSRVRRIIDNRDFSFEYTAKKGRNIFFNPLRRLGLRYIEIEFQEEIDVNYIGLIPTMYPFKKKKYVINDELRQKIYDTSVYTLECCYHEHYEDCPWREQSFYTMDSRNQILCGYYAFRNLEQVKSSLNLILKDNREDNLLSLCFPISWLYTIPSFSLHFFRAIEEYLKYTKDTELVERAYPKLVSILSAFTKNMNDEGLVCNFKGEDSWNFYEWKEHLDFPKVENDIILNSLYILALESLNNIAKTMGYDDDYSKMIERVRIASYNKFYDKKAGLFIFSKEDPVYSELANALAVLTGIASKNESKYIALTLTGKNLRNSYDIIPMTLSMKCFLYDALLKVDKIYESYILNDIDKTYKKMLDDGATTFYETELGEKDFDGAGSLCHGWSALPIYYYQLFKVGRIK